MKKLLILLTLILSGCSCMISQIPPQRIYAGAGCSATLPDYRLKITASDNCEIASFTQLPAPGFVLNAATKTTTVTVKATDATGNFRQIVFTVTLLDTVKPILTVDPTLLSYQMQQVKEFYDFGDKLLAEHERNFINQSWIDSIPGLRDKLQDSSYYKKSMLIWTSPAYAMTGEGDRTITFYDSKSDTIIIRR
jgi:uncharacterized protein YceK